MRRPRQLLVDAGQGQAPLLAGAGAFPLQQFRIDQYQRLIALLAHIEHDQALMHIDLSGGKADASRRIHGLEHVVCQLTQCIINHRYTARPSCAARIGILQNYELCHGVMRAISCFWLKNLGSEAILRSRVYLGERKGADGKVEEVAKGVFDLVAWYQALCLKMAGEQLANGRQRFHRNAFGQGDLISFPRWQSGRA